MVLQSFIPGILVINAVLNLLTLCAVLNAAANQNQGPRFQEASVWAWGPRCRVSAVPVF